MQFLRCTSHCTSYWDPGPRRGEIWAPLEGQSSQWAIVGVNLFLQSNQYKEGLSGCQFVSKGPSRGANLWCSWLVTWKWPTLIPSLQASGLHPPPSAVIMSKRGRKSMQQPLHGIILLLHLSRVDAGLLVAGQLHLSPLQSQQEQSGQSEKLHTFHVFIGSIPNNSQNSKNLVALSSLVWMHRAAGWLFPPWDKSHSRAIRIVSLHTHPQNHTHKVTYPLKKSHPHRQSQAAGTHIYTNW